MAGAKVPLTFRIYKGGQLLREETLEQPVIKVGKLSSSHLRLEDESVSRMHAVIEVSGPGDISIIDLGSTKGTVVNGQKVNKARLQDGDQIVLGDLSIELSIGSVAGPSVAVGEGDDDVTRVDQKAAPAADAPTMVEPPVAAPPAPAAFEPPAPRAAPQPPAAPKKPAAPTISAPPPAPVARAYAAAPSVPAPAPAASPAPPPAAFGAPATAAPTASPPVGFGADDLGGAGAVEVAAMLGDSVVGVKHVMNPRGGKVTGATYGLFAAGAILLVFSAFAFAVGVRNSAKNQAALDTHLEERKPIGEFRPHRISVAYDFLAFGGAAGGILCVILGLVRFREEKVQPYFRIGQASDVDFPTDEAPSASFALVAPMGDDFVFNYGANMTGEMTLNGQSQNLQELGGTPSTIQPGAMEVRIPPNARIRVTSGHQTFLVSAVSPPRRQAVPLFASVESTFLAYLGGSAILFLGVVALLNRIPPDSRQMHNEMIGADARLAKVQTDSQEDPKLEEQEEDDGEEDDSGGTGTKMALDEGKMGKKESTRQSGQYAMEKTADTPQLAKEKQMEQAAKAGILGVLKQSPGGAFASLTGTADFSSGLDDRNVYGGLIGNEVGEMQGGWGYGVRGVGPGGGGTGWGTIGTGRYGLIGHGSGTGEGYGTGSGRGGMRGRKAVTPQVRIGQASASGDLDKNIIRRYIRRQIRRIQNCYERELLVKPSIAGTVVTQFQISPQGKVQGASASGVDGKVSGCVAGVIRSIKFPEPKGGGYVNVRYPFIFRAAGN
jgi:pSer/pThr/pTyr-binding forkhead associated (FHA) protein